MRLKLLSLFVLLATIPAMAASHSVQLTWTASPDSTAQNPGTISIFRANATCPATGIGTLSWTLITSTAPAAGPYTDSTVSTGNWCYYVTATIGGATSAPSNTAGGSASPFPPQTLQITIQ